MDKRTVLEKKGKMILVWKKILPLHVDPSWGCALGQQLPSKVREGTNLMDAKDPSWNWVPPYYRQEIGSREDKFIFIFSTCDFFLK